MNTLRRASGLSALSLHYCHASPGVATRHAEVRALRVARTLVFAAFALLRTQGLSMLKFVPGQPASLAAIVCMSLAGATQSVWDGVYTAEQARRGQPIYNKHCASCHGEQLTGGEDSPPLTGGAFLANWNGLTVGDLFERIRVSMPQDRPGRLTRQQNADILSYLLSANQFPEGTVELPSETERLKQIRFEAKR